MDSERKEFERWAAKLHSEALLYAGKARTMAAKLFNDPHASQVDAGDLLLYMARLVDELCLAAAPAAPAIEPVPKRVHELLAALTINDNPTSRARFAIELRSLIAAPVAPAPALTDELLTRAIASLDRFTLGDDWGREDMNVLEALQAIAASKGEQA
jgi:hypothetical protein